VLTTAVVDCAGARMGGASRLLVELQRHLSDSSRQDVHLLGLGRSLSPAWLATRELRAARCRPRIVVALNNVSFVGAGQTRTVLLRNALHFPLPGEEHLMPSGAARRIAAEARVVRAAVRRADLVVVPASSMAMRVEHWLPRLHAAIAVRPHPVSPRPTSLERVPGRIVCPVLLSPYKQMGERLRRLIDACSRLRLEGTAIEIVVTATPEELREEGVPVAAVTAAGRLDVKQAEALISTAQIVYYPTEVESFGYPLAEARANGQPVLAADNAHNAEVAGSALMGFSPDVDSLERAVRRALAARITPSIVNDAAEYFNRLLEPV
jgi:glycosyltransferase involved in cell wall biosynthesis